MRPIQWIRKILKEQELSEKSEKIFNCIEPGDICIDCGANIGLVTSKMADRGAIVYAFEPNPYAFKVLVNTFKNNKNVVCINKAVFNKNTKMKLFLHQNSKQDEVAWSTGSSLLDEKGNIAKDSYIEVEVVDVVEFIKNLNTKIKILKIDVEGAEIEILNKLIDSTVIHNIGKVYAETHEIQIPGLLEKTNELKRKIRRLKIKNINLNWI